MVVKESRRQHGAYVKYKLDGCRCYPCCFADSEYRRNRERAIAYGTWQPYVDAEPVRVHVRSLMGFGIGWKRIAALAGVPTGVVTKLLYGHPQRNMAPSKQMRSKNAAALLAVEPSLENLGSVVAVDATGTHRRLQALIHAGWPKAQLAKRLEMLPSNFGSVLDRPQVTVRTVRAVMRLYDELWRADPRENGVDAQAYSRTVNYARDRGWAPVGAWDDDTIDDPATFPDWTGKCGTPEGYHAHYNMRIAPACQPCRDAVTVHRRERREAARAPRMAGAA
ncbi:hypothetical protein ACFV2X_38105 [Streptomyces sp. NPDC059679]|uniref:hypothetical protein n=1 Tax=Streptomyces sp. NPDC059679 TaxID=3346903 RepID=UPI0036980E21